MLALNIVHATFQAYIEYRIITNFTVGDAIHHHRLDPNRYLFRCCNLIA